MVQANAMSWLRESIRAANRHGIVRPWLGASHADAGNEDVAPDGGRLQMLAWELTPGWDELRLHRENPTARYRAIATYGSASAPAVHRDIVAMIRDRMRRRYDRRRALRMADDGGPTHSRRYACLRASHRPRRDACAVQAGAS